MMICSPFAGDRGDAVSALGDVKIGAGGRNNGHRGLGLLGGIGFHLDQLHAVRILYSGRRRTEQDEKCQGKGEQEGGDGRD